MPGAIDIGCIDEVDAYLKPTLHGSDRGGVLHRPPGIPADRLGAKANLRHMYIRFAKTMVFHLPLLLSPYRLLAKSRCITDP